MERNQIAELVQKAQAGDSEAMNQLLQTAYKNVLFQCRRIMKHPEDAEDMAQEVLLKIYETLGALREPERFISWANTIATRRCINERMRNPKDLQFLEDEEGNSILDDLEELDQQSMPEAALDNEETRRMVRELIDKLPEAQRVAVMSHYNAEMSVKEIAELLGVSENTVKSRLNYGRKAIEKGVKEYEKQGIKLYGLSPLPFLLYFLRSSAEMGSDAAASAAASAVLSAGAAAGTAAAEAAGSAGAVGSTAEAAASGAAAGTGVSSAAGTGAAASASVGASTAAAGTGAAGAGAAAGGLLGGLGVKAAAILLAGTVAVGGGAVLLSGQQSEPAASSQSGQTSASAQEEPEEDSVPADPDAPAPLASYTTRRTTVAEEAEFGFRGIYLETPLFEEVNEGYRQINAYFDQLHQAFNAADDPKVATVLARYESTSERENAEYTRTYGVSYQDGYYLSVSFRESVWPQGEVPADGRIDYTFDVRTGELLELSDLHPGTDEEVAEWVAEAIRASEFGNLLSSNNYPSADDGFYIASGRVTQEDIERNQEIATNYQGGPHEAGTPMYTWHLSDTIDDVYIPLPAELTASSEEDQSPEAESSAAQEGPVARSSDVIGSFRVRVLTPQGIDDANNHGLVFQSPRYYVEEGAEGVLPPVYQQVNEICIAMQEDFTARDPTSNLNLAHAIELLRAGQTVYYREKFETVTWDDQRLIISHTVEAYPEGEFQLPAQDTITIDLNTGAGLELLVPAAQGEPQENPLENFFENFLNG